jgi:hypothetical protein
LILGTALVGWAFRKMTAPVMRKRTVRHHAIMRDVRTGLPALERRAAEAATTTFREQLRDAGRGPDPR